MSKVILFFIIVILISSFGLCASIAYGANMYGGNDYTSKVKIINDASDYNSRFVFYDDKYDYEDYYDHRHYNFDNDYSRHNSRHDSRQSSYLYYSETFESYSIKECYNRAPRDSLFYVKC